MGIGLRYHPWASVSFYQQISTREKRRYWPKEGALFWFSPEFDRDFFSLWAPSGTKWFFFLSMSDIFCFFGAFDGVGFFDRVCLLVRVKLKGTNISKVAFLRLSFTVLSI